MANEDDNVVIPDHKILSVLGQGGMARVYLARDEAFDRLVAVKVIDSRFSSDEQFQKRFEREAKTAGGLSHPNIVPVHRYGLTQDRRPYLTMAYLDGGSLKDRMQRRGAMSVDESLSIIRQVASALYAAHSRSIVHRDLKPDNVMFQGETAYLTDFGIAKLLNAVTELTGTGLNPGTVRYFSPEQAQERAVDARSDIYALGILLFEMLTGRSPIEANTMVQMIMRIVYTPPTPLPEALRGLQPFMDILLAKDPADRLGSCQDVVTIIDAMMRNWTRYGDADRMTDGVTMQPSGAASASVDLDDDGAGPSSAPSGPDPFTIARQQTEMRGRGDGSGGASAAGSSAAGSSAAGSGPGNNRIATPADDISGLTDLAGPQRSGRVSAPVSPAVTPPTHPPANRPGPATNPSGPRPELSADTLMNRAVASAETTVRGAPDSSPPAQATPQAPARAQGTHIGDTVLTPPPRSANRSIDDTVLTGPARPPARTAVNDPASLEETVVSRTQVPSAKTERASPAAVPARDSTARALNQQPYSQQPDSQQPYSQQPDSAGELDSTGLHAIRTPQGGGEPPSTPTRRGPLLGVLALLLFALLGGAYWWMSQSPAGDAQTAGQPPANAGDATLAQPATLHVQATPSDASVTVVGQASGMAIADMKFKAGEKVQLRVSHRDFATLEQTVTLRAGENNFTFMLQPQSANATSTDGEVAPATLTVNVTPTNARVKLAGRPEAYRDGLQLRAGDTLLLRIEHPGYATREESVVLRPGSNNFDFELQPATATAQSTTLPPTSVGSANLCVTVTPADAEVAFVGRPDAYECGMPLKAGESIRLRIERRDYVAQNVAITLRPGANSSTVTLLREARKTPARVRTPRPRPGDYFRDALNGGGDAPRMVVVAAGGYRMGGSGRTEGPVHNVNINQPFAVGVYEVTFDEFDRFSRAEGRPLVSDQGWGRGRLPVINVSWNDAKAYVQWLSQQTGYPYRLLSEAEWEYVNRAGTSTTYWWGDELIAANCDGCGVPRRQTMPVDSFGANAFGLYNTLGNVWEWVEDCYAPTYAGAPADGRPRAGSCSDRVYRGGSYFFDAGSMRATTRKAFSANRGSRDVGFRVAVDLR